MKYIDCHTQAELDAALKKVGAVPRCLGGNRFVARGSAHVEAWDSAHVEARDSAHVEAWDSAHVEAGGSAHVEAWDSAHVVAWDSAHVVARDSAHVVAWDSAHVEAGKFVAVTKQCRHTGTIKGGVIIKIPIIKTAADWCDFYGAKVAQGVATLYKAVDDRYISSHKFAYAPGSTPIASDWDGGDAECGGGCHFCAHPLDALSFKVDATRFIACPVRVKDIVVHADAQYPTKVKAKGCAGPCYEVDRYGERVGKTRRALEEDKS